MLEIELTEKNPTDVARTLSSALRGFQIDTISPPLAKEFPRTKAAFHIMPLSHPATLASYWKLDSNFIGYRQMQLYCNSSDITIYHLSNKKEETVNKLTLSALNKILWGFFFSLFLVISMRYTTLLVT